MLKADTTSLEHRHILYEHTCIHYIIQSYIVLLHTHILYQDVHLLSIHAIRFDTLHFSLQEYIRLFRVHMNKMDKTPP